jgi:glycosyltransferase involved in cell wall biosynthesis
VISIPSISIQELEKVYAMADAYIYLGWEPYSLALYEAAILGLPIIANSEIGAVKDCVKDHKSGYLVYDYSPNKVAQMIFNVVNGEINEGAFEMSKYIIDRRGVEWATDQLYALIR